MTKIGDKIYEVMGVINYNRTKQTFIDGTELIMRVEHFNIGTTIIIQEPTEYEDS